MITLNKLNLPDYFVNMESNYSPIPNHIGAKDLTQPPLMRTLKLKHWEELENDVKDMMKKYDGIAWDAFCKKHCRWALTNIRIEIPTLDGLTIICKPDYYHVLNYILADFKRKSVWNLVSFDLENVYTKEDIAQLNIYDYAMFKHAPQLRIDKLELHIGARDWRAVEKLRGGQNYPDIPFGIREIPRWTHKEQEEYIDAQIKEHKHNPMRECTDFEKGRKPNQYAIMKKDRKSALRVLDSEQEAIAWCREKNYTLDNKLITIVKRPGECSRCLKYCPVSNFCPYNPYKKGK